MESYNNTLEAAEKAVRSKEVSCGDFILKSFTSRYNPDALYAWAGSREKFLEIGGTLNTIVDRGCDKARVELAIQSGRIPKEVADEVLKRTASYSKPDKVGLP